MTRDVKLDELDAILAELDYPVARESAVERFDDVTLALADGEENLGSLVARSGDDSFDSVDDLQEEVLNLLPREAVGEPHQSEGEG